MRADPECISKLPADATLPASEEDFKTEFLELTIAVCNI